MNRIKIGLLILILVFAASGLFPALSSHAGSITMKQIQYVQENKPFVYEGFDSPNDYNWEGDWDPRADRDWDRHNDYDRDTGNSPGATTPCGD
jgi:hypothetical protein